MSNPYSTTVTTQEDGTVLVALEDLSVDPPIRAYGNKSTTALSMQVAKAAYNEQRKRRNLSISEGDQAVDDNTVVAGE